MPQVETKRRRITKACDFCHRRGRKCKSLNGRSVDATDSGIPQTCLTCLEHGVACTWDRISAKRGVKSRQDVATGDIKSQCWVYDKTRHGERDVVHALILTFFDTVYPIFPFFDLDETLREWADSSLSSTRDAFARLMAICALSSCHIKNGAVLGSLHPALSVFEETKGFLEDAQSAIPSLVRGSDSFGYLQAIATLVLVAIQLGDAALLHQYLGQYHTLTAQYSFHDEARWPTSLETAEKETRKRLFWSMYRIEVHSALVMGHTIRCPEMQAAVSYPTMPGPSAGACSGRNVSPAEAWVIGWNHVTDLYRVLEYVIICFRSKRMQKISRGSIHEFSTLTTMPIETLLSQVTQKQASLPRFLTQAFTPSDHVDENRCGFQVANIVCTMQLLKTLSFACEDVTFADACVAARQLIEEFSTIPPAYTRAIGSPMHQELVGVGHLLSSFIGRPLSFTEYQQLRSVILSMVGFLESLGASSPPASAAGLQLSQHVARIDAYIANAHHSQNFTVIESGEHILQYLRPQQTTESLDISATGDETSLMVPLEYLQHIPWPGMLELDFNWPIIGLDDFDI